MTRPADPIAVVDRWIEQGIVKGASLLLLQRGAHVIGHHAGLAAFAGASRPVTDATLFMIASITKTLTASCFMQFVEEGAFALSDPAARFIPEFGRDGKGEITFLQLLTHTSGLPEQVEGKDELRLRQAPMAEFLERICAARPLFGPGSRWSYSNCGFAVLARAVELVSGRRVGELLAERVLIPLGMIHSALGFDEGWDADIAEIELPAGAEKERAFVNSRYWRALGAPWGAMASRAADLARFAEAFRNGGVLGRTRLLTEAGTRAMTRDQLHSQPGFDPTSHPAPHGLAWRLRGAGQGGFFGDLTSPASYGHTGATGTFLWVDPQRQLTAILLTNREQGNDEMRFARLSNAIVAACA